MLKAQHERTSASIVENNSDREKYGFWLSEWLKAKKLSVKESTYIRYQNIIKNHINPELGKYPINKISTGLIESFVSDKLTGGRLDGKGGLSAKTMSDILVIIKESFKYAQGSGGFTICCFDRISLKKAVTK